MKRTLAAVDRNTGRSGPCFFIGLGLVWALLAGGRHSDSAARAAAPAAEPRVIARPDPSSTLPVEIKHRESADGKTLDVEFRAPQGIFRAILDFSQAPRYRSLRFRIRDTKSWEGIEFYPADKPPQQVVELKSTPGVDVKAKDADCLIEFSREAIKILEAGGKFQFVDAYRN